MFYRWNDYLVLVLSVYFPRSWYLFCITYPDTPLLTKYQKQGLGLCCYQSACYLGVLGHGGRNEDFGPSLTSHCYDALFLLLCLQDSVPGVLMNTASGSDMESGAPSPQTLCRLVRWLGIPVSSFLPRWLVCSDALSIFSSPV